MDDIFHFAIYPNKPNSNDQSPNEPLGCSGPFGSKELQRNFGGTDSFENFPTLLFGTQEKWTVKRRKVSQELEVWNIHSDLNFSRRPEASGVGGRGKKLCLAICCHHAMDGYQSHAMNKIDRAWRVEVTPAGAMPRSACSRAQPSKKLHLLHQAQPQQHDRQRRQPWLVRAEKRKERLDSEAWGEGIDKNDACRWDGFIG